MGSPLQLLLFLFASLSLLFQVGLICLDRALSLREDKRHLGWLFCFLRNLLLPLAMFKLGFSRWHVKELRFLARNRVAAHMLSPLGGFVERNTAFGQALCELWLKHGIAQQNH